MTAVRNALARLLLRALDRLSPFDDDPVLLVPAGGVHRRDSIVGDDLWIAEQQVAWWLDVGQRLRTFAGHAAECRAVDDCDARCSCGLLDLLSDVDEVVTCTITDDVLLLEARRP